MGVHHTPAARLTGLLAVGVGLCLALVAYHRFNRTPGPTSGRTPWPSDDPVWRTRHATYTAAARTDRLDVIGLGDSIMRAWEDVPEVWAERVTARLSAFFGIGLETTCGLLWRLDDGELSGASPKLVIVLIGTNNRWVNDDPADIADGIAAVVRRVTDQMPAAKVLVLGLLPQGWKATATSRRVFADVNRRLLPLDDGRRVFVRDVGRCLLESDGSLTTDISPDGTHLTPAGYVRFADALRPLVRELCEE
jgi:beta-glucosidase